MEFITGGAFQGKCAFATQHYAFSHEQIFCCTQEGNIDFSAACIAQLEAYTWYCVKTGTDAVATFQAHRNEWENSVLICDDICCGVVPMQAQNRQWREETGRLCAYLCAEATRVYRIFCGLEQCLK